MYKYTLIIAGASARIKMKSHQDWWLAGGYDLEIGHCLEVAWGLAGGYSDLYAQWNFILWSKTF